MSAIFSAVNPHSLDFGVLATMSHSCFPRANGSHLQPRVSVLDFPQRSQFVGCQFIERTGEILAAHARRSEFPSGLGRGNVNFG
jgi:hypothetical protein